MHLLYTALKKFHSGSGKKKQRPWHVDYFLLLIPQCNAPHVVDVKCTAAWLSSCQRWWYLSVRILNKLLLGKPVVCPLYNEGRDFGHGHCYVQPFVKSVSKQILTVVFDVIPQTLLSSTFIWSVFSSLQSCAPTVHERWGQKTYSTLFFFCKEYTGSSSAACDRGQQTQSTV